ncbi:hypothetical protein [Stenotrophomonas maltophilia]|uniref:hypothetical protein n=1 Tax=Stenotrophomonas maltophilia TaxID=40324 RepID=UPI0021C63ACF|nr:hypothetical protein [Stenotrophomonas maltophilia]MCU1169280.1 hypothetical protein [Stenotrophomonas maltophilia]
MNSAVSVSESSPESVIDGLLRRQSELIELLAKQVERSETVFGKALLPPGISADGEQGCAGFLASPKSALGVAIESTNEWLEKLESDLRSINNRSAL